MKHKPVDISKCGMIGFCDDGDTIVYDRKKKRYKKGKHKFFDSSDRVIPIIYKRNES